MNMSLGVLPRAYDSKLSLFAKYQTPSTFHSVENKVGFLLFLFLLLFGKVKSTPSPRPKFEKKTYGLG